MNGASGKGINSALHDYLRNTDRSSSSPLGPLPTNVRAKKCVKISPPPESARELVDSFCATKQTSDHVNLSLAFKCLYSGTTKHDEIILLVKKHQHYVVFLNSNMFYQNALTELSTIYNVFSSLPLLTSNSVECLLDGVPSSVAFPIPLIISFHFFVIQATLHKISSKIHSIIKRGSFAETSLLWSAANAFLSGSNFDACLSLCDSLTVHKYYSNGLKMLSGFQKLVQFIHAKIPDAQLQTIVLAFKLKVFQYTFLLNADTYGEVSVAKDLLLDPFVRDLRAVIPSGSDFAICESVTHVTETTSMSVSRVEPETLPWQTLTKPASLTFDDSDSTSVIKFLREAIPSKSTVSAISFCLDSLPSKELFKSRILVLTGCVSFLESVFTNHVFFRQCLKEWVPRLSELLVTEKQSDDIRRLSRLCFEFGKKHYVADGFLHACQLDLELLPLSQNREIVRRRLNRIEQSIVSLFDLEASTSAVDLARAYVKVEPSSINREMLPAIVAACVSSNVESAHFFFGDTSCIELDCQEQLFLRILAPLKSQLPDRNYGVISILTAQLANKFSLATQYKISQLFDVSPNLDCCENPQTSSDYVLTAGILMNCHKNNLDLPTLNKIRERLCQWLKTAHDSELRSYFSVFQEVITNLMRMGFFGYCVSLIDTFKSSSFNDPHSLLELELLLSRCLLKSSDLRRLPQLLKSSGQLLKHSFTNTISSYQKLINLKLIHLEYFVKMYDEGRSKTKYDEIKSLICSRPEFTVGSAVGDLSLQSRLSCFITIARFSVLTSMINTMSGDIIFALKNLKLSIKLSASVLRKLDSSTELTEMRFEAIHLLCTTCQLAFKASKRLGLSKEALHFINELTKYNDMLPESPLQTFIHFVAANYLMCTDKRPEALQHLIMGSSNTWGSSFLRLTKLLTSVTVNFDSMSVEDLEAQKEELSRALTEYQRTSETKLFAVSYSHISELVLEAEFLLMDRFRKGTMKSRQDGPIGEMLTNAIFSTRSKLTEICSASADVLKQVEHLAELFPSKIGNSITRHSDWPICELIECKDILARFVKESYLCHLEVGQMHHVHSLFNKCVHLLSCFGLSQKPQIEDLLKTSFFIKDLAHYLPYLNQRAIFTRSHSLSDSVIVPELGNNECEKTLSRVQKTFYEDLHQLLPESWVVVTLDICQISGDMIIYRLDSRSEYPSMLKIPIDRRGNTKSTFDGYLRELKYIIAESNRSTKINVTASIRTKEDRKQWWKMRFELDSRLKTLLEQLENRTIGGLKGFFRACDDKSSEFLLFESHLNDVWQTAFGDTQNQIKLERPFVELFYCLSPSKAEGAPGHEDLADLIEYTANHLEVRICSKLVKDENWISDHISKVFSNRAIDSDVEHLILIPSHSCGYVPWESMSFLRGKSVSRMPSVISLMESLRRYQDEMAVYKNGSDRLLYLVNPGSDLKKTQSRFEPVLSQLSSATGLAGMCPSEDWFTSNLFCSSLYIYVGHGGGEQYLRSSTLFKAKSQTVEESPTALLMGCSSSAFHEHGRLEPSSNVFNWLVCGTPAIMTNLWDITDKDIDIFSLSLFDEWGLVTGQIRAQKTLSQAMIKSRNACTLRFLNGAAPVLHGLPLNLN